jgi:ribosomal-protein-alanine N-acetyltransferase
MPSAGSPGTRAPGTDSLRSAPEGVSVRRFAVSDLEWVMEVEGRSFTSPWSAASFTIETSRPSSVSLVAELDGKPVGYAIFTRYADSWHLMTVAVDPGVRRRGIARTLIQAGLSAVGSGPVTLEVRPSNAAAISLYSDLGFIEWGTRPGYYPDDGEDALIMWRGDPAEAGVPAEAMANPGRTPRQRR